MVIKVHGIPLSTCTARVLLCLCEKGLQYKLVPVDVENSAHKKPPYLSLNPFGQIPALEDGHVKIFESRAICKYLVRKYNETRITIDLLGSSSLTDSTLVDTWMEVESHQFNPPTQACTHSLNKIIEIELRNLAKVLDVYEERLSEYKYLGGDFYSMADLHHIPYLVYFIRSSKSSFVTSRPCVNAWWNDISSRPLHRLKLWNS
ncbi:hypothetical protein ES288_A10G219000v1 [Gossypium darwinii]|uniref:glutathione transferase n=1 Tax=Gossypium darwinii TaxID=34276 RepID=A0A5D2F3G9_GOSDA|nr:hypothetical protein ES288_A10G219000v1 [Gossypium darwinii]